MLGPKNLSIVRVYYRHLTILHWLNRSNDEATLPRNPRKRGLKAGPFFLTRGCIFKKFSRALFDLNLLHRIADSSRSNSFWRNCCVISSHVSLWGEVKLFISDSNKTSLITLSAIGFMGLLKWSLPVRNSPSVIDSWSAVCRFLFAGVGRLWQAEVLAIGPGKFAFRAEIVNGETSSPLISFCDVFFIIGSWNTLNYCSKWRKSLILLKYYGSCYFYLLYVCILFFFSFQKQKKNSRM